MKAAFVYSDRFQGYNLSPSHPLKPVRLRLVHDLLNAYGVFGRPEVERIEAQPATEEEVLRVHTRRYYDVVADLSAGRPAAAASAHGLGTGDTPAFPGMLGASLLYTGASLQAARMVSAGKAPRAFNPSGGLHHAMADRASGFCVFNDAAVAIADLLERHERVLYLDIDAHHGDGVQAAFYNTPRVLTVSLHESGRTLFPGTGFPRESGEGAGAGYSVNIPLSPGTADATYVRVFDTLVPPLVEWYDPEIIVAQLGIDTHVRDPLTHLELTTEGFARVVQATRDWGRPLVALGGGGYDVDVVRRAWTIAFAALAEIDLPDALPPGQPGNALRDHPVPARGYADLATVEQFADQTIADVHRVIFRRHGIREA